MGALGAVDATVTWGCGSSWHLSVLDMIRYFKVTAASSSPSLPSCCWRSALTSESFDGLTILYRPSSAMTHCSFCAFRMGLLRVGPVIPLRTHLSVDLLCSSVVRDRCLAAPCVLRHGGSALLMPSCLVGGLGESARLPPLWWLCGAAASGLRLVRHCSACSLRGFCSGLRLPLISYPWCLIREALRLGTVHTGAAAGFLAWTGFSRSFVGHRLVGRLGLNC